MTFNDAEFTVAQRVANFLTASKINQKILSEITGISEATISNIVTGKTDSPKADFFTAIAVHYPEVSLRWLLIGEGEMYGGVPGVRRVDDNLVEELTAQLRYMRGEVERLQKRLEEMEGSQKHVKVANMV